MSVAIDCMGLAKTVIIYAEIILYLLRLEFRKGEVRIIIHPRFYKNSFPNDKCPCSSGIKYKKCCMHEVQDICR